MNQASKASLSGALSRCRGCGRAGMAACRGSWRFEAVRLTGFMRRCRGLVHICSYLVPIIGGG